jgi:cellulose synthase/poly-beta-1,6-N-acetylglucosamine synthase-like glycosyltransferase
MFLIIRVLVILLVALQLFYLLVSLITKPKHFLGQLEKRRYDFLILAKNEAKVIGDLIDTLKNQNYPANLIRIFVLADNCTDQTAEIAQAHGAITFINKVPNAYGKGIGLKRLIALRNDYPGEQSDAVIFFDADNVVDAQFTQSINNAYQNDDTILIGYRGTKNFGTNIVSTGSSILFFREAHFLHHARNRLGLSTHINGTGFMVPNKVITETPWSAFSLIEDIEFTIIQLMKNRKIQFVRQAKFYDEQPINMVVSMRQRLRWIKGSIQIFFTRGWQLLCSMFKSFHFSKLDLFIWITPLPSLIVILSVGDVAVQQIAYLNGLPWWLWTTWTPVLNYLFDFMVVAFGVGMMTIFAAWKEIDSPWWHKVLAIFTFPLYSLTFIPLFIFAPFGMVNLRWYKTPHSVRKSSYTRDLPTR